MKNLLALLIVAVATTAAQASTVLFFSATSPTTSTVGGAAITVDLILSETVTSNINNFGVAGASFTITRAGSGSIGTPIGNPAFDPTPLGGPGGADPVVTLDQTSILGVGQGGNQVVLGSFVVNTTSAGNGTLSLSAFGNPSDIAVYTDNLGTILDLSPAIFVGVTDFSYSITAVPEPSSAILLLFSSGVALVRFRRRLSA